MLGLGLGVELGRSRLMTYETIQRADMDISMTQQTVSPAAERVDVGGDNALPGCSLPL